MKLQTLLLSLASVAACVDDPVLSTESSNLNVIGANNAVVYNVAGSSITNVHNANWGADWSHVIPLTASDGTSLVFLYARELGTAKVEKVSSDGSMTTITSMDNFQTGWDEVVASKTLASSGFNLMFYRRSDSTLKALNITGGGTVTNVFEQTIPSPSDIDHPGWDIMRSAKFSSAGDVLFYDRLAGEVLTMKFSSGSFAAPKRIHGWRTTWDQMATGDMNGDKVDDLVLYSQETGDLRIEIFDSSGGNTNGTDMPNAEQSAGAQLAVGDFGGGGANDILLYQVDGSPTFENGRLRIWTDNTSGTRTLQINDVDVQDGWTSVVPIGLGASKKGMFFYSNQRVLKVRVHPVRKSTSVSTNFAFSAADTTQLEKLGRALRKTYAAAGLSFDIQFGALETNATIGTFFCGNDPANPDTNNPVSNTWVANNIPRDEIPVLLPLQPGGSGAAGCSGLGLDWVKSSYGSGLFVSTNHAGGVIGFDDDKHYAHELGHFLGLRHVDIPSGAFATTLAGLDMDDGPDDNPNYQPLYDTPPVLGEAWWFDLNSTTYRTLECDAGSTRALPGTNINLVVQPTNVMSYNDCAGNLSANRNQGMFRISQQQQQAVRHTLYTQRHALIGL